MKHLKKHGLVMVIGLLIILIFGLDFLANNHLQNQLENIRGNDNTQNPQRIDTQTPLCIITAELDEHVRIYQQIILEHNLGLDTTIIFERVDNSDKRNLFNTNTVYDFLLCSYNT